jgi:hypothetical protein
MLIEFNVSNFRSIRDRQTFSMVASADRSLRNDNVHEVNSALALLHSAVLYGPNAAGKSNLVMACATLQQLILASANFQPGTAMPATPYRFNEANRLAPTCFDILFIAGDVRYNYCVEYTAQRVHSEWLVAYPLGKPQKWFERTYNPITGTYSWSFGRHFRVDRKKASWTNENSLFLSKATSFNEEAVKPIFSWFQNSLVVCHGLTTINPFLTMESLDDPEKRQFIDKMIEAADLSIQSLALAPMLGTLVNIGGASMPTNTVVPKKIVANHRDEESGALIEMELGDESAGTRKVIDFAGGWQKVLNEGATLMVDELDSSLHPLLTKLLVSYFHSPKHNSKGAQLIMTTHDTTLLDSELFRRDQIWFMEKHENTGIVKEKSKEGRKLGSQLYSLLAYKPRKDEKLERGYLRGRFGALPFVGSARFDLDDVVR